jgi:hypothetical protein
MANMRMFFNQVLQDSSGVFSSKRTVTFICVLLMATGFLANLFGGFKIDQFIYESIMYIVIAGLGFSGAEKFAPKKGE